MFGPGHTPSSTDFELAISEKRDQAGNRQKYQSQYKVIAEIACQSKCNLEKLEMIYHNLELLEALDTAQLMTASESKGAHHVLD